MSSCGERILAFGQAKIIRVLCAPGALSHKFAWKVSNRCVFQLAHKHGDTHITCVCSWYMEIAPDTCIYTFVSNTLRTWPTWKMNSFLYIKLRYRARHRWLHIVECSSSPSSPEPQIFSDSDGLWFCNHFSGLAARALRLSFLSLCCFMESFYFISCLFVCVCVWNFLASVFVFLVYALAVYTRFKCATECLFALLYNLKSIWDARQRIGTTCVRHIQVSTAVTAQYFDHSFGGWWIMDYIHREWRLEDPFVWIFWILYIYIW